MKQILRLTALLILLAAQFTGNAQSAAQKRVLVYFKTGVQRNAPPNQNTVTITSSNINTTLSGYGLSAATSLVRVSTNHFPEGAKKNL